MDIDKDRRKSPRTPADLPLDIYDLKGKMVVGEGRLRNVSTHGALMVSRKPLKKSEPIRVHVIPSGKAALEITGKVVWTRKKPGEFEYGIRFNTDRSVPLR